MQHSYSTASLSSDKSRVWQDFVSEVFVPVTVDIGCLGQSGFYGEIHRTELCDLEIALMTTDPESAFRNSAHILKDDPSFYLFVLAGRGVLNFTQFDRECFLPPEHFTLIDSSEPFQYMHDQRVSALNLKIPRALFRARITELSRFCGRSYPATAGLGRTVAELLRTLAREAAHFSPITAGIVENNVLDLLAALLESECRDPVTGSKAYWAVCNRCISYIKNHFADPTLSPRTLADAMGVSVRYIHKAFEESDRSMTQYLLDIRLERCHTALLRSDRETLSIKQVALGSGFRNQSHFSTAFKRKFGVSPLEFSRSGG